MVRVLALMVVAGVISGVGGAYATVKIVDRMASYERSDLATRSRLEIEKVRCNVFGAAGRRERKS